MAASTVARAIASVLCFCAVMLREVAPIHVHGVDPVTADRLDELTAKNDYILAYFTTTHCTECERKLPAMARVKDSTFITDLQIVLVNDAKKAFSYGIREMPALVFFRKGNPVLYDSVIEPDDVTIWMEQNKEVMTKELNDDDFEHLTQASTGATTGNWLILFYKPTMECGNLRAIFEAVASRVRQRMNVAKIDIAENPKVRQRFKISKCPTILFFRNGKYYHYTLADVRVESLYSFMHHSFKNFHGHKVPTEPTPFDQVLDKAVSALEFFPEHHRSIIILGGFGLIAVMLFCLGYCSKKQHRPKFD